MLRDRKARVRLAAVCTVVVAVVTTITMYDDVRLWPTRVEHAQVVGRSCKNELALYTQELRAIRREITQAQSEENRHWERSLEEQRRTVQAEIERVKRECGWS